MKANLNFVNKDISFWANVRAVSEAVGYTNKESKKVLIYETENILKAIEKFKLKKELYFNDKMVPTKLTKDVCEYSDYRANILNNTVRNNFLNKDTAKELFEQLYQKHNPQCPIPMNKQKGDKKAPSYFTAMINILIEYELQGKIVDYDPRELIKIFKDNELTHTLSRRVDGAYPSTHSPVAIWEIKEYYYTTTFGSRVANGVYETLLDGFELEEVFNEKGIKIKHYLFIDDYRTWWEGGKSYLCRIIDMLHMGKVDEVICGKEILEAIPRIVKSWNKSSQ